MAVLSRAGIYWKLTKSLKLTFANHKFLGLEILINLPSLLVENLILIRNFIFNGQYNLSFSLQHN